MYPLILIPVMCIAGIVETGPGKFTIDVLEGNEVMTIHDKPKKTVETMQEALPPC